MLEGRPEGVEVAAQRPFLCEQVDLLAATFDHHLEEAGATRRGLDQRPAEVGADIGPLPHDAGCLLRPLAQQAAASRRLFRTIGGAKLEQRGLVDGCDQPCLAAEMVDDEGGRHLGGSGDFAQRGRIDAAFAKDAKCSANDRIGGVC